MFCENFDKKPDNEKNDICNKLAKRWKNIKDTYTRSLRKKNKSGQAAESRSRYIYAAQLSFLETAGARTETQSSLEETVIEDTEQQKACEYQISLCYCPLGIRWREICCTECIAPIMTTQFFLVR
ncbi:unnamed protein product [Larinioides sclopetarius]|uniref:MADF domain-containing protein n=1 Tax=Larinioides sclopetarius TaxID=280406 RepID=A0AAV2BS27_9ARAC